MEHLLGQTLGDDLILFLFTVVGLGATFAAILADTDGRQRAAHAL